VSWGAISVTGVCRGGDDYFAFQMQWCKDPLYLEY
jgi:hypothetical protein